jgi:hypothetical protein
VIETGDAVVKVKVGDMVSVPLEQTTGEGAARGVEAVAGRLTTREIDDRHRCAQQTRCTGSTGPVEGRFTAWPSAAPPRDRVLAPRVGASLVELPAMKLAPPVWETEPASVAADFGFHLLYGVAVAQGHRALTW